MDIAALVLSIFAVLISGSALAWQVRRWWWEQRLLVQVEGRSFTYVTNYGEPMPIVGVRVTNNNPRYPIRINAVAFTPASQSEPPDLWFDGSDIELPRTIGPRDGDTIDIPVERISEVEDPLRPAFVGWIELKTGVILSSQPHQREP